ncbi:MAG: hypothetical protein QOF84_6798 [Streptomyces sp.]|jgi:uncharacterized protein YukE|nr:hypothetical protein [Streptomyces sp.]
MSNVDGIPILVTAELGDAPGQIAGQRDQVVQELNDLKGRLAPLAEEWTLSVAASDYQNAEDEWNTAALGLFGDGGVLDQIVRALNINYANYEDAETANINTWANGN